MKPKLKRYYKKSYTIKRPAVEIRSIKELMGEAKLKPTSRQMIRELLSTELSRKKIAKPQ